MTKTIRLNDTQLILLSHGAQNDTGAMLPLPASLQQEEDRARKELKSLLRRDLIAEREVTRGNEAWRSDGDLSFGLFLTDKGCQAIGVSGCSDAGTCPAESAEAQPAAAIESSLAPTSSPRAGTKLAAVMELLTRKEGATLDDMVKATGWLPHTTRAALTGLKKKSHTLTSEKVDGVRRYYVAVDSTS
ncbi:MAG: DUF3489 domain-containing protein [Novosphingobium sp.]|nr:DUF3489 domain-containing protein [Novosphingobium sp.]